MNRSKIFIASSGRTLVLAERLRDELFTDFCQATLWSEEGRLQPGSTIIEMLEGAAKQSTGCGFPARSDPPVRF